MKKTPTFILLVIASLTINAQNIQYTNSHFSNLQSRIQERVKNQHNHSNRSIEYFLVGYESDNWNGFGSWEHSDSGTITYDASGRETENLLLSGWTGTWLNFLKIMWTYSGGQFPDGYLYQLWDDQQNLYTNYQQAAFTYDAGGNKLTHSTKMWNAANNTWEDSSKFVYTYNNNHITSELMQQWDSATGQWINVYDSLYSYDMNGNTIAIIGKNWNTGANHWDSLYKATYTWNSSNQLQEQITQVDDLVTFIHGIKYSYTYDTNNMMTVCNIFTRDATGQFWEPYQRNTYTYNGNDQQVNYTVEVWDQNAFVNQSRSIYTYNIAGDKTGDEFFNWNIGSNQWDPAERSTFSYDTYHNLILELEETYGSAYENYWRYFYYYSPFNINGVPCSQNELEASVVPNPGNNGKLQFSLTRPTTIIINVFDDCGKLLNHQTAAATTGENVLPLETNGYSSGTYFIQVLDRQEEKTSLLKFIKY